MPRPGRLDDDTISGMSWIVRHCLASTGHQDQNDELLAPNRLYEINVLIIQVFIVLISCASQYLFFVLPDGAFDSSA